MGYIEAICISSEKGVVKKPIREAFLHAGWGILGDAHAGPSSHRQISILPGESIDRMKRKIPDLEMGSFAENLITRGMDLCKVKPGERLQVGKSIILEVSQIGKECHHGCRIKELAGDCIMPTEGIFAVVIKGGVLRIGDTVKLLSSRSGISGGGDPARAPSCPSFSCNGDSR